MTPNSITFRSTEIVVSELKIPKVFKNIHIIYIWSTERNSWLLLPPSYLHSKCWHRGNHIPSTWLNTGHFLNHFPYLANGIWKLPKGLLEELNETTWKCLAQSRCYILIDWICQSMIIRKLYKNSDRTKNIQCRVNASLKPRPTISFLNDWCFLLLFLFQKISRLCLLLTRENRIHLKTLHSCQKTSIIHSGSTLCQVYLLSWFTSQLLPDQPLYLTV